MSFEMWKTDNYSGMGYSEKGSCLFDAGPQ
jgi:hypothetical protein